MAFPERVFDSSGPESEPQAPHLNIVDSAAETVRASMAEERASDEAMPREPVSFPAKQKPYVGETPQEVHAQHNEVQRKAGIAARKAGQNSFGVIYSEMSNDAYRAQLARRREQDPGYKATLAQIQEDARREHETP
jgi:hypothetical protein